MVKVCLTVRPTSRTETKVGHSDPGALSGKALAQRIKGTRATRWGRNDENPKSLSINPHSRQRNLPGKLKNHESKALSPSEIG
jgi:hypothetical protein